MFLKLSTLALSAFLLPSFATADKPGPTPPNDGNSWQNYTVSGLETFSVTGGTDAYDYETVVIMLHGGGGSGYEWWYGRKSAYNLGWFGDMSNLKYVFPTSALDSNVWYNSMKNTGDNDNECGGGLADDCAYDLDSIAESANDIAERIEFEMSQPQIGGNSKEVFLAGFLQGAQMTSYMQIAKLEYPLGGAIVMDGFPLPPLGDMPGAAPEEAKTNATYYGQDMNFMIWHGEDDTIFPLDITEATYAGAFEALGVTDTLRVNVTQPGQSHTTVEPEFTRMVEFIREYE